MVPPIDPRQTVRLGASELAELGRRDSPGRTVERMAFVASDAPAAQKALADLTERYGTTDPGEADAIVALGGDGFMLQALHRFLARGLPIYGMNRGSVGFLMNEFEPDDLRDRLSRAAAAVLHPLRMVARTDGGDEVEALAFNEVSLLRQTRQAARIRIIIDGVPRMTELTCDGILLATSAGSTAYNLSAHGPIIPLGANLLALTPVSAFRPRRWRGALLRSDAHVRFEVLDPDKRPVSAVADDTEVRDVIEVEVNEDRNQVVTLLYDPDHGLEERILREQFAF